MDDGLLDFLARCDAQLARDPDDMETWCARCWAADLLAQQWQQASRGGAPAAWFEA